MRMRASHTIGSGRLARAGSGLVSGLLILAFFAAGWRVIPHAGAADSALIYREAASVAGISTTRPVPVFVMRADRSVVRHGAATTEPGGGLRIEFFRSVAGEAPEATEALLFEPTLEVLWVASTDESQDELRRLLDGFQEVSARTIEEVITSDVFNGIYRPMLRSILTDAVSHAWEDAKTQRALAELLESSDTALRRVLTGEIEAILASRVKDALWEMFQANWVNAFGVPFGYELDYEPVMTAVTAVLRDPRVRETFLAFGSDRLQTDEARRLTERFAIGLVDSLMRDRRVPKVVTEMFWDPRLRAMLQPVSDALTVLFSALPRNLGGLGEGSSLNPLAAHVFKAMVLSQHIPLVLFVTPEDRARIERIDRDAARALSRVSRAEAI
jgi:hypothetical protein